MNVNEKEEQDDIALLSIAEERMKIFDPSVLISQAEIDTEFRFTSESLGELERSNLNELYTEIRRVPATKPALSSPSMAC